MSGSLRRALFAQFGGAILKSVFIKPDCRLVTVYRQPPDIRITWQLCQVERTVTATVWSARKPRSYLSSHRDTAQRLFIVISYITCWSLN